MHRIWLRGLAIILLIGLAASLAQVQAATPSDFQAAKLQVFEESPALPILSLKNMQGETVALQSFAGKVVLLNFWTTW